MTTTRLIEMCRRYQTVIAGANLREQVVTRALIGALTDRLELAERTIEELSDALDRRDRRDAMPVPLVWQEEDRS